MPHDGEDERLRFHGIRTQVKQCLPSTANNRAVGTPLTNKARIELNNTHQLLENFICELTLFQELSSPTTTFPTTLRNAGSSPNCKDNTQWFWSSAVEVIAPRTAGKPKGLFNSIEKSRLAIAGLSRLVPIILPRRMSTAAE